MVGWSMSRIAYAIVFPVALLAGAAAANLGATGQERSPALTGPTSWVAFVARIKDTDRSGALRMNSTVARSSDGSYYWRGEWPDGRVAVVIHNVPQARNYNLPPGQSQWTARPMVLPPGGYRPARAFVDRGFRKTTHRRTGIETFVRQKEGRVEYVAPSLNFFPLRTVFPEGTIEEAYEIRLEEPDAQLFLPPPDAVVTVLSQPGGIISSAGTKARRR
jgi:hypothetical protein